MCEPPQATAGSKPVQQAAFSYTTQYIAWYARHGLQKTAIVEGETRVSYQTLADDLARCCAALTRDGVRDGMLVGIETRRDRYLNLLLLLACEAVGATATSLFREDLTAEDPVLRRCGLLLLAAPLPDSASCAIERQVLPSGWLAELRSLPFDPSDRTPLERNVEGDRIARIVRTSGTTGRPKAIVMSHACQQEIVIRNGGRLPRDILLNPISLCLYNLAVRAVYVRVIGILQNAGTVIFGREDHVHQMLSSGTVNHAMFTVGDMERIVTTATPPPLGHRLHIELVGAQVSRQLRQLIRERLTPHFSTRYSSNETNMISAPDDDGVGTLCPGADVRIVDDAGLDCPAGAIGFIRVRTETMASGYFDDPALTAATFIDGWYNTNDVGYMPAPGKLVVLGRADDLLNIGGVKVPPAPLEEQIKRIPGVTDAVLLSIETTNAVNLLLAAVETSSEQPPADLTERVNAILARYVRHFELMPLRWFPRTGTGKVQRHEIKAAFQRRQLHLAGEAD
jgi:acyl-coenzyme A synthetase/AMP-(fatty) acid ligase